MLAAIQRPRNLACAGCGKIDYPEKILDQRLSVDDCLGAIDECSAPVVVLAGGEADPAAAAAGRKAVMASRQNAIFSVTMLFFMVYKGHAPGNGEIVSASNMGIFQRG